MLVTAHDAFMAMYYALEAATDEYPNQGLKTLVQDCDPFVWKDRLSAGPAVWTEFSGACSKLHGDTSMTAEGPVPSVVTGSPSRHPAASSTPAPWSRLLTPWRHRRTGRPRSRTSKTTTDCRERRPGTKRHCRLSLICTSDAHRSTFSTRDSKENPRLKPRICCAVISQAGCFPAHPIWPLMKPTLPQEAGNASSSV